MKSIAKTISLFLVLVLVSLSGCVGNSKASAQDVSTQGLSANSLKTYGSFAGEESAVVLNMEIENVGDAPAENVCVQVFGQTWMNGWYNGADGSEGCTTGGTLNAGMGTASGDKGFIIDDFSTVNVPNPVSSSQTYDVYARAYYKYRTRMLAQVETMNNEGYRDFLNKGGQQSAVPYQVTGGPIVAKIDAEQPIRVGTDVLTLRVHVQNVGGGRVFNSSKANGETGYGSITTSDYDVVTIERLTVNGANSDCVNKAIKVPQGSDGGTGVCKVTVTSISDQPRAIANVEAILVYGYQNEYQTSVELRQDITKDDFKTSE